METMKVGDLQIIKVTKYDIIYLTTINFALWHF